MLAVSSMMDTLMDSQLEWVDDETVWCLDEHDDAAWLLEGQGYYQIHFYVDSHMQGQF